MTVYKSEFWDGIKEIRKHNLLKKTSWRCVSLWQTSKSVINFSYLVCVLNRKVAYGWNYSVETNSRYTWHVHTMHNAQHTNWILGASWIPMASSRALGLMSSALTDRNAQGAALPERITQCPLFTPLPILTYRHDIWTWQKVNVFLHQDITVRRYCSIHLHCQLDTKPEFQII